MINKIINSYISPFKNINKESSIILLAIFINGTGQLFLIMSSLYFSSLNFTIYQIGVIIAIYNGGILIGSLIGGNKSEQFGIKLMKLSLLFSGLSMRACPKTIIQLR